MEPNRDVCVTFYDFNKNPIDAALVTIKCNSETSDINLLLRVQAALGGNSSLVGDFVVKEKKISAVHVDYIPDSFSIKPARACTSSTQKLKEIFRSEMKSMSPKEILTFEANVLKEL